MKDKWDGNNSTTRESNSRSLSEVGKDGNRTYENGTYGQNDYTVRERSDGSGISGVYIRSDSERGYSHDAIDRNGNIVDSYRDYLLLSNLISRYELSQFHNSEHSDDLSYSLTKKLKR